MSVGVTGGSEGGQSSRNRNWGGCSRNTRSNSMLHPRKTWNTFCCSGKFHAGNFRQFKRTRTRFLITKTIQKDIERLTGKASTKYQSVP